MALDPERLLWKPGLKLISIPASPPIFTLHPGDIFTIEGFFEIDWITRLPRLVKLNDGTLHTQLRRYTVTKSVTASDPTTIPIFPFVIESGQYQNVLITPSRGIRRIERQVPHFISPR